MTYAQMIVALKQGHKMKLDDWIGYWFWDGERNRIRVQERTGDITDGPYVERYQARNDWNVSPGLGFEFAVCSMKKGHPVRRASWDAHRYIHIGNTGISEVVNADKDVNEIAFYNPDKADIEAMDWEVYRPEQKPIQYGHPDYTQRTS